MKPIFIVLLLLISAKGYSQHYINKNRSDVKEMLGKSFLNLPGTSAKIIETDSSITREVKGPGETIIQEIYIFDKSGKCNAEKTITACDSCIEKLLKRVIDNKKYRWKKINLNQYISKYTERLLLETQAINNKFSFTILRTGLDRKTYRSLIKNR